MERKISVLPWEPPTHISGCEEEADGVYVRLQGKDRKGYEYPVTRYMVGLEGIIRRDRKKLLAMTGF
ncbi:MAG: hypothetical protein K2L07_01880 [Lachnospiraceae bacterium]|nr:hypothetical protein [Lachnospiraceae bacterium]